MKQDNDENKAFPSDIANNRWLKFNYYLFYLVRKSSTFFMIWISLILMYGVICAHTNEIGQDEFYRFIFLLQSPLVIFINTLAMLMALWHSISWFNRATKHIAINYKVAPIIPFICLWGGTLVISALLLFMVLQ